MKFTSLSITDHAFVRYSQRVNGHLPATATQIEEALKVAKLLDKNEPLPLSNGPRILGICYAHDTRPETECLFVLEPVDVGSYRLVTILTRNNNKNVPILKNTHGIIGLKKQMGRLINKRKRNGKLKQRTTSIEKN